MRHIASIQSLRACAALMVVIGHAQSEATVASIKHGLRFTALPLLPWGAGVDLFFVISGFIMVVASERLFAQPGASVLFMSRRVKRIVPLYWLFTTLVIASHLIAHKPVGLADSVASYLFWPRDIFGDGVPRPLFLLGWTLNYEMFFYVLFALAVALPRRAAVGVVAAALLASVIVGQIFPLAPGPLTVWTQPIVLEFVLGMSIGLAWEAGIRLEPWLRIGLAGAAIALLTFDVMHSAHQPVDWITPNDFMRVLGWGLPAAALVAAAALGRQPLGTQRWRAASVALGDASYALYLVHPFVLGLLIRAWTVMRLDLRFGFWPLIVIGVAAAVAAALAIHRWFERPVARRLSSVWRPRVAATETALHEPLRSA